MKNIFKTTVFALLVLMTMHCKKNDNVLNPDNGKIDSQKEEKLRDFKLEKDAVELYIGQSVKVKILSGNGIYTIAFSENGDKVAQIVLSEDKQAFIVKGISKGRIIATVTDTKKQTTQTISITVFIPKIPEQERIADYMSPDRLSIEDIKKKAEEYYQQYKALEVEINKLPELTDDLYKAHKRTQEPITKFLKDLEVSFKNNPTDEIIKKAYDDFFSYGIVFQTIELMARKAEQFRKQYPNESHIRDLISKTFDGLHSSQEGQDLVSGFNKETLPKYNEIVKFVNELNAKF